MTHLKEKHYPQIDKSQLIALHYLAADSNHCYGNTVDVFLYDLQAEKILDMGTIYDYMDMKSHLNAEAKDIGPTAYANRHILRSAMVTAGF